MQEAALKSFNVATDSSKHLNWNDNNGSSSPSSSQKPTAGASYCSFTGVECINGMDVATLVLQDYGISGEVPSEFGQLTALRRLGLGENNLHGTFPGNLLNDWPDLLHLELFRNDFTGPLPTVAAESAKPYHPLKRLLLQHNDFSGTIPTDLCRFENLHVLDVSGNPMITGTLPECLGEIDTLYAVHIIGTSMTGTIPEGLCRKQPSEFGCDYVACPVGTYQPNGGHQSGSSACQPCPSSRFLGSTDCPPTSSPSVSPSMAPSRSPSLYPSESPSAMTIAPTVGSTSAPTSSVNPEYTNVSKTPAPLAPTSSTDTPSTGATYSTSDGTFIRDVTDQEVNWRLVYTAVFLYLVAMISMAMVRRMARGRLYEKRRKRATDHGADTTVSGDGDHLEVSSGNDLPLFHRLHAPQPNDSDPDFDDREVSLESESGWNDSDSSPASILWHPDQFLSTDVQFWDQPEVQEEWTILFSSAEWEEESVETDVATFPSSHSCSSSSSTVTA